MGEDNLRFDSQSGLMRERTPAKCRRDVYRVTVSDHLIVMPGCRMSEDGTGFKHLARGSVSEMKEAIVADKSCHSINELCVFCGYFGSGDHRKW